MMVEILQSILKRQAQQNMLLGVLKKLKSLFETLSLDCIGWPLDIILVSENSLENSLLRDFESKQNHQMSTSVNFLLVIHE